MTQYSYDSVFSKLVLFIFPYTSASNDIQGYLSMFSKHTIPVESVLITRKVWKQGKYIISVMIWYDVNQSHPSCEREIFFLMNNKYNGNE